MGDYYFRFCGRVGAVTIFAAEIHFENGLTKTGKIALLSSTIGSLAYF